ncbi:MAG: hypothetical protein R3D01_13290 [Hyphomicrobiales bacterium]
MTNLRAIVVAVLAFSLAVLPVSAAEMRSSMAAGMSGTADQAECCPQAGHCEKQTNKDCGHSTSCALKCSVLPATQVAAKDLVSPPKTAPELAVVIPALRSALEHPPLPPPRV